MTKLPMIDDINDMWSKDSDIDETSAGAELLKIGKLNAKYSRILANHSLLGKKKLIEYAQLKSLKYEYYNGTIADEDLAKHKWQPWLQVARTKDAIDRLLEKDDDLVKLLLSKSLNDECVEMCKYIMKELNNRTWSLKAWVDYQRHILGNSG